MTKRKRMPKKKILFKCPCTFTILIGVGERKKKEKKLLDGKSWSENFLHIVTEAEVLFCSHNNGEIVRVKKSYKYRKQKKNNFRTSSEKRSKV